MVYLPWKLKEEVAFAFNNSVFLPKLSDRLTNQDIIFFWAMFFSHSFWTKLMWSCHFKHFVESTLQILFSTSKYDKYFLNFRAENYDKKRWSRSAERSTRANIGSPAQFQDRVQGLKWDLAPLWPVVSRDVPRYIDVHNHFGCVQLHPSCASSKPPHTYSPCRLSRELNESQR